MTEIKIPRQTTAEVMWKTEFIKLFNKFELETQQELIKTLSANIGIGDLEVQARCCSCGSPQAFLITSNELKQQTFYFCRECKKEGFERIVFSLEPAPTTDNGFS